MLEVCFNVLCSGFNQRFARYRQCTNGKCPKSYWKQNNDSSSYLLKSSLLVEVLAIKSRQQTGERCSGVFPAPVCSPCQRCSLSAPHRAAAAHRGQTERPHQRRREGERWRRGGGFRDLRRVYLICDFKATPAESQSRAAPAEPSAIRLIDSQTRWLQSGLLGESMWKQCSGSKNVETDEEDWSHSLCVCVCVCVCVCARARARTVWFAVWRESVFWSLRTSRGVPSVWTVAL